MNEPHDSEGKTDFNQATWAATSQTVVTAIRNGALPTGAQAVP